MFSDFVRGWRSHRFALKWSYSFCWFFFGSLPIIAGFSFFQLFSFSSVSSGFLSWFSIF